MENALNRAVTITFGNTGTQRNEFNNAGWQTLIRHAKNDATVLAAYTYTLDNVGNRASMHEQNGDRVTWSYDSIYQLTREQHSGSNAYDITYTYDAVGNRATKLQSAVTTTYSYDSVNRLDTETTPTQIITYTFDNNGNNTMKDAAGSLTTMTWSKDNQMTVLALPSGALTMTYDGQGFRRSLQDASGTQKFLYDLRTGTPGLDPVLLETNASDVTQVVYTPGISLRRSGATKYFHADALGSVRLLLDSSQAISDTYILDAWGNPIASSGSTVNPFRFVGLENYYTDTASGLLLLGVRYYDPKTGRFVSVDPEKEGVNWYGYVSNCPANLQDATGAWVQTIVVAFLYSVCIATAMCTITVEPTARLGCWWECRKTPDTYTNCMNECMSAMADTIKNVVGKCTIVAVISGMSERTRPPGIFGKPPPSPKPPGPLYEPIKPPPFPPFPPYPPYPHPPIP